MDCEPCIEVGTHEALLREEAVPRPSDARRVRYTGSELLSASFPEPVWVVPGLVPEGLTILAGRPKLGKSWLALQIAFAKACGGMVLGRPVAAGKVLYLALEDGARRLQNRMREQEWTTEAAENTVFILAETLDGFERLLAHEQPDFCVVDTFAKLVQGSGLDHDNATQNTDVWGRLHTLAQTTGTALLVVEHHKKAFAGDGVSDILGSTAKGAVADTIIGLYRERGKPDARLVVTGRDLEDDEMIVHFDPTTASWQPTDTHTGRKHEAAILDALRSQPDTISGLARRLDVSKGRVSETLAELEQKGKVVRGEGRLYHSV